MKKAVKKAVFSSLILCSAAALLLSGGIADNRTATAQTPREVAPFARWSFDGAEDSGAWLYNSGKSGAAYNLDKTPSARRENWGANNGGVNFADNSCLYLSGDKYIFNELSEFTLSVKFYATRNPYWYSSLFSWDELSAESATNLSRFSMGYRTGQDWLRYSDAGILGSCSQEGTNYGAFFTKGEPLLSQNAEKDDSGWWTFIYSVKPGGVAITYLATGTTQVNYVKAFKVPADYSLKSDSGVFSIGASFRNESLAMEYKSNAILDDVRIYDFAMTETQMNELRWTDKVCISDVSVSSEIRNGTVTASKTQALSGERILLNVTPDSGYVTQKVLVNDEEILPVDGIYYTHMTKSGLNVYAEFVKEKQAGDEGNKPPVEPQKPSSDGNQSEGGGQEEQGGCNSSVAFGGAAAIAGIALACTAAIVCVLTGKKRRGGKRNEKNK